SWSEKLLIGEAVIQAEEIVEIHRPNPDAFAELKRSGLVGQSRSGRLRVERRNRGARLAGAWANVEEAPVDFAVEAGIQPFVERLHRASTHDRLSHAVEGSARKCGSRTQAEVRELVEGDRLDIQIENRMFRKLAQNARLLFSFCSEATPDRLLVRIDELKIETRAPRSVNRTDSVRVPANPPVIRGLGIEVGEARSKSVLGSDAAHGNMQRLPSEEFLSTREDFESP